MNAEEIIKQYATGERNFAAVNLTEANLSGANLSKANLSRANLSVANLSGSNFSEANLSKAKLNVTKLSGANLSKANLSEAILNVANLTLADLSRTELRQASLVRAEMARADLSYANLSYANLSGADLKDAKLRNANLNHTNLSRADLKWAVFTAANLAQANLHGTDLSSADLSRADLSNTELRQANLSRANLSGANLSGANLRWADLSGADLSWADLSGARLSGANLTGVNLSNANLLGTILVHADLTRASLIGVDWTGADLSGATLTGAKLYGVLRFGVKTEGALCEWIDLSPNGDQSDIVALTAERAKTFFHEKPPTVHLTIDMKFDVDAHSALAATYCQIARHYGVEAVAFNPPNIRVGQRRTTFTFEMQQDAALFLAALLAVLPFQDAAQTQENLFELVTMLESEALAQAIAQPALIPQIVGPLRSLQQRLRHEGLPPACRLLLKQSAFFDAPTVSKLVTSNNQTLTLFSHPHFGRHLTAESAAEATLAEFQPEHQAHPGPGFGELVNFMQSFPTAEMVVSKSPEVSRQASLS